MTAGSPFAAAHTDDSGGAAARRRTPGRPGLDTAREPGPPPPPRETHGSD